MAPMPRHHTDYAGGGLSRILLFRRSYSFLSFLPSYLFSFLLFLFLFLLRPPYNFANSRRLQHFPRIDDDAFATHLPNERRTIRGGPAQVVPSSLSLRSTTSFKSLRKSFIPSRVTIPRSTFIYQFYHVVGNKRIVRTIDATSLGESFSTSGSAGRLPFCSYWQR